MARNIRIPAGLHRMTNEPYEPDDHSMAMIGLNFALVVRQNSERLQNEGLDPRPRADTSAMIPGMFVLLRHILGWLSGVFCSREEFHVFAAPRREHGHIQDLVGRARIVSESTGCLGTSSW